MVQQDWGGGSCRTAITKQFTESESLGGFVKIWMAGPPGPFLASCQVMLVLRKLQIEAPDPEPQTSSRPKPAGPEPPSSWCN